MPGPLVAVMMGVSGSGKTTIAEGVAAHLGWDVIEGDKFHPPANIAKMSSGIPLDDADRMPWLRAIAAVIDDHLATGNSAVVACSALKRSYRAILIGARRNVLLIYLQGSKKLIAERVAHRTGHFMPAALLDSQFATLEEPGPDENPIIVSVAGSAEETVEKTLDQLRQRGLVS
ncbi:MAG: gluconokinase [Acetobacteraceae bacterium]